MSSDTKITSQSSSNDLPNDTAALKEMVVTLLAQIDDMSGQLHYLKRQLFGKKSEKLNPNQRLLFESLYEELQEQQEEQTHNPKIIKGKKDRKHNGRNELPKHLPREIVEIDLPDSQKQCSKCDTIKESFDTEVTEKLEFTPACFYVKRYERRKYSCPQCHKEIEIAQLPPMAIDKGIAGESLLAHIATSKYCDHVPLSRLQTIFRRGDVEIATSSMSDWMGKLSDLFEPLVKRMHEIILTSDVIFTDDTKIPVKTNTRAKKIYNGYLWVYIDPNGHVIFDFTPTRSRHGPIAMMKDYTGYVQADAYSGYDEFFRTSEATEVGCNAHARRKFDQALESDPARGARMVGLWNRLYDVERDLKDENASHEDILQARQTKSKAILDMIKPILDRYQLEVLPKTPIGKAVTYALNQWQALCEYINNPILSIDNNLSERTIRMVVIGRKNYLFAGSEAGAKRAAIIYSMVASCKLNNIDPFAYMNDVLKRVSIHPASQIDDLLPANWQPLIQ